MELLPQSTAPHCCPPTQTRGMVFVKVFAYAKAQDNNNRPTGQLATTSPRPKRHVIKAMGGADCISPI